MTRAFDEMNGGGSGAIRDSYKTLAAWLENAPADLLQARSRQAELLLPPHGHHLRRLWRPNRPNG
jgi:uncharacterized circularly permuted ATP-grasp superfamily protein